MIKKYLNQVKEREPHERRQTAMRWAMGFTAVIFVGWMATLPFRLAAPAAKTAEQASGFASQMAAVFSAFSLQGATPNTLEVASTTTTQN